MLAAPPIALRRRPVPARPEVAIDALEQSRVMLEDAGVPVERLDDREPDRPQLSEDLVRRGLATAGVLPKFLEHSLKTFIRAAPLFGVTVPIFFRPAPILFRPAPILLP
jgi:hypothetical protein